MEEPSVYKQITEIKFGMMSPSDIRKLSAVEIRTADTYDEDGAPIPAGLMDGRLGTLEPRQRCATCGSVATRCPGHFGHIELAEPVIHVGFVKVIYFLLTVSCRSCGRLLLNPEKIEEFREKMESYRRHLGTVPDAFYDEIRREARKNVYCPHCSERQYKVEFEKPTTFYEVSREGSTRLPPSTIRSRLERVRDDDLLLLGFDPEMARPERMILQTIPVPPLCVRPSITLESGIRSEDDLTHKLVDIIRINQRLRENKDAGAPPLIIQDLYELLQYHVTTYFDNEASGIPPARHRSGRALKTISQRLKGKEGRFRSNLSGKRVDFSARTVISPDPNIEMDEVGVPYDVAQRLTVPVKVTQWNLEEVAQLVRNGPEKYPGALYVIRPDGKRIRLEFVADRDKLAQALQPGFIVERHLRDGDVVIFNRQPSLHKMSIMAHRVKVLPYKTFRLHLSVCPPYNADFDGDEMNLHVPQSEEAQAEARLLMSVQNQILSPRYGGPIIGAIRDFITALYLLTYKSTFLKKDQVFTILNAAEFEGEIPDPVIKEPEPLWSGKQIFSLFLPKGFYHVQRASICRGCKECRKERCPHDAYVIIENGVLKSGVIDKSAVGAEKAGSIFHRIVKEYGADAGQRFLTSICKLGNAYISYRGFTYGLDELDLPEETKKEIDKVIKSAKERVSELIEDYQKGRLRRLPGQTFEESLEIFIMNELAEARDKSGEIADRSFKPDNSGITMTRTGARGSSLNIGQMAACIGQQSIRGKRITRGYRDRPLPHFEWKDASPEACGFIYTSYRDGLNPTEFFFHAMAGREGLVDTAVRTQQSGYMQRRLINALETLRVEYDGTVRDPLGNIIQFKYGDDGVDPMKSDHGEAVNVKQLIEQVSLLREGKPAPADYIESRLSEVKERLPSRLMKELRENLIGANLTRSLVDYVIEKAVKDYEKGQVEPGEAIGIIAAQSIGEPGTQMTLRTFHYAGVREQNVTLGLPRIIEIVDARKEPSTPIMTIYLDKDHRYDQEKAKKVAQQLLFTTVRDVVSILIDLKSASIIVEPKKLAMEDRGITTEFLKDVLVREIPGCEASIEEGKIVVKVKGQDLRKLSDRVASTYVKGVPGIRRILLTKEKKEWVIHTDGSNLSKVLRIEGVDHERTITNDIHEIAQTLGIEAARNAIIKEMFSVLEEQGLDVDLRHIMLVADIMTSTGEIRQIGRHGVSGEKTSILAKAAFELTVPSLIDAAVKGGIDTLSGVAENVIVGQPIPIGTGRIDLFMKTSE